MARWRLGGDGRRGDGWRWTARLQLDIKGRRDGESTAMGDEERCKCDGDVGPAAGGSDKHQRGIKT